MDNKMIKVKDLIENFFQLSTDELKAVLEFIQDIINQKVIIPEEDEPTWLTFNQQNGRTKQNG